MMRSYDGQVLVEPINMIAVPTKAPLVCPSVAKPRATPWVFWPEAKLWAPQYGIIGCALKNWIMSSMSPHLRLQGLSISSFQGVSLKLRSKAHPLNYWFPRKHLWCLESAILVEVSFVAWTGNCACWYGGMMWYPVLWARISSDAKNSWAVENIEDIWRIKEWWMFQLAVLPGDRLQKASERILQNRGHFGPTCMDRSLLMQTKMAGDLLKGTLAPSSHTHIHTVAKQQILSPFALWNDASSPSVGRLSKGRKGTRLAD